MGRSNGREKIAGHFLEVEFRVKNGETPMRKQARIGPTALADWLLDYVDAHKLDLTDLAEQAGLSVATLYALLHDPERVPPLETCLRLAMATGKSVEEMFRMAGLAGHAPVENLDPDRLELLRSYQELPRHMRHILCLVAQMLERALSSDEYAGTRFPPASLGDTLQVLTGMSDEWPIRCQSPAMHQLDPSSPAIRESVPLARRE